MREAWVWGVAAAMWLMLAPHPLAQGGLQQVPGETADVAPRRAPSVTSGGVQIVVMGAPATVVDPGALVTLPYRVANPSGADVDFQPDVSVPTGWHVVSAPDRSTLGPGASVVSLLTLRTPRGALSDSYTVGLRARGGASAERVVAVARQRELRVSAEDVPSFVVSGTPDGLRWKVWNRGNDSVAVRLHAESEVADAALSTDRLALGPDEAAEVAVALSPPEGLATTAEAVVILVAMAEDDSVVSASARARVRIIPEPGRRRGRVPGAMVVTRLAVSGSALGRGTQASVEGTVPLRADSLVVGHVRVRTPDPLVSRYGRREAAAASLTGPGFRLRGGSGSYALSPLAGGYRYGRGGEVAVERGSASLTALYRRPLRQADEWGGSVGWGRGDVSVSANALWWAGGAGGRTFTARARSAGPAGRLDAEVGVSGREALRLVHRVQWGYSRGPLTATVGMDEEGLEHPGSGRGTRWRAFSVAYALPSGVRVQAHAQEQHLFGTGPEGFRIRRSEIALTHSRRFRPAVLVSRVGVSGRDWSGADGKAGLLAVLGASVRYPSVSVSVDLEAGGYTDGVEAAPTMATSMGAAWSGRRARLSAGVGRTYGRSLSVPDEREGWRGRFAADYRRGASDFNASLFWTWRRRALAGLPVLTQEHVEGRVSARVPVRRGTLLNVQAALSHYAGADRYAPQFRVGLDVALRGRTPLPLRLDGVRGRLYDHETGVGIQDVLVSLGDDVAVTDAEGLFEFLRPDPGTHLLQIDELSLGSGLTPVVPLPLPVVVPAGGRAPVVEVPVAAAAVVSGQVRVYRVFGGGGIPADTVAAGPVPAAMVDMCRGDVCRTARADARGRFRFGDVAPGVWEVRAVAGAPQGARPEARRVEVEAGGTVDVGVRVVLPERRARLVPLRRPPPDREP